ncbi:MAG TPA: hypothetical protein VGQ87_01625 [Patescibacteria group bacterium]|jgi:hypothetical protein|nr:hypothetical protein [Patescibacteria group bacterium]
MGLKSGQQFFAMERPTEVGHRFRAEGGGVLMEVIRVLTEVEVKVEVPEFHLAIRAVWPDEQVYWVECRPLVS